MNNFPIRIRLNNGEEKMIRTSSETPQGVPFTVIQLRVGRDEKPGIQIEPAY